MLAVELASLESYWFLLAPRPDSIQLYGGDVSEEAMINTNLQVIDLSILSYTLTMLTVSTA